MKHRLMVLLTLLAAGACVPPALPDTDMLLQMGRQMAAIAEKVSPGVVQVVAEREPSLSARIRARAEKGQGLFLGWSPVRSIGSGFILDTDGYILTTAHTVEGAKRIRVKLRDGTELGASLTGIDDAVNVALLKVEAPGLRGVPLGDSDELRPGTPVLTVSNPFGFLATVHWGVVGGVGRKGLGVSEIENLIQLNANVNPGDSGGAVVNSRGEVVGMLAASMGTAAGRDSIIRDARGEGIAFAIPIGMVKEIIPRLKAGENVEHGWLGVGVQELTPLLSGEFAPAGIEGVLVAMVVGGSPAAAAGLAQGDIITALDGTPVRTTSELLAKVSRLRIGKGVKVSFFRGGKEKSVTVTVGPRRGPEPPLREEPPRGALGLGIEEVAPAPGAAPDSTSALRVESVRRGSAASRAGLRRGDLLYEANRKALRRRSDWEEVIRTLKPGGRVLVRTQRGFFVISPQ